MIPRGSGQSVEEQPIAKLCQDFGYFDLLDKAGNNLSDLDEQIKPVESRGAPIVAALAAGKPMADLSPADRECLLKWIACLGPLGPNGRRSSVDSAADYLRGAIENAAVKELGKICQEPERLLDQVQRFAKAKVQYVVELQISAHLIWQIRARGLISSEFGILSKMLWTDVRRSPSGPEAFTTDCMPQIITLGDGVDVAMLPLGPNTILVGLPPGLTAGSVTEIRDTAWCELRDVSIAQASACIVGRTNDPAILPLHFRIRDTDPLLAARRQREAILRDLKPLPGQGGILTVAAYGPVSALAPLDTQSVDVAGTHYLVRMI